MADCMQTWRKKLRLQELIVIARNELKSGKNISQVNQILSEHMQTRWRFVGSTQKQYLIDIDRILNNLYVL
ncbi:MAG: hypothetical protein HRU07_09470 [Nitrosopumilus sp.]|nr:hypothetical protein [Nitrosopumilus sp.]NRA06357.1 hypothetical protein [Nitrosopumilus sp.]